ncbi:MAG TPA: oligopeptide ABC transporter ATP-binding protein [Clostridiales bacterium]|nr:oligopeptide ABC transporter ATP-binding protein [Clostridiales bacterium]HCH92199.1 oligopeptide ABC transporter ATP-binding protein [Clostridiales bacterium]
MDTNVNKQETLLRVEHLCQYFKLGSSTLKAVNDVSFDIKKGEVFGLVGESGCGKTTTGRSIIKLYNCTSGNVYFEGRRICAGTLSYKEARKAAFKKFFGDLKRASSKKKGEENAVDLKASFAELKAAVKEQNKNIRKANHDQKRCDRDYAKEHVNKVKEDYKPKFAAIEKKGKAYFALLWQYLKDLNFARKTRLVTKIQMVFQDPIASLDPRMTVREIIAEGLTIRGIRDKKVVDEKVYDVLEKVGLVREHAGRYPHEFSGGQRQRIGVARAIIMEPEMIIADEPISALDVSIQAQVINLLNDLRHELGLTIMFIAHDLSVVKYFSDRIGVMYFGNMVELATSDRLFAHPLHPYTKSLLSAIPLPDPIYEKQRKRIVYNPLADHDYSVDKPQMREVEPGHFVSCNQEEFERYVKICKGEIADDAAGITEQTQAEDVQPEEAVAEQTAESVDEMPVIAPVDLSLLKQEGITVAGNEVILETANEAEADTNQDEQ